MLGSNTHLSLKFQPNFPNSSCTIATTSGMRERSSAHRLSSMQLEPLIPMPST